MNRYARWLLRNRVGIIVATLLTTAALGVFAAGLKIVIDPAAMNPQEHPYVQASNHVDKVFGSKYLVLIGITPTHGDVFQPVILERVQRITRKLETTPGVVRSTMMSLTARQAKAIRGTADGFEVRPLLNKMPLTDADRAALKASLESNPIYLNTVVSPDFRTAAILVELRERPDGFQAMVAPVKQVIEAEAGPDVTIAFSGSPVFLAKTEEFAARINILFPIALLVIGLLHFEAFRTKQGLILPLVTALMAVLWGLGFMGLLGRPLDIFNSPTPILILAVAAGHAVQLLKRYYEDFEHLRGDRGLSPTAATQEAVICALVGVGPVMIIAGSVAALGFFSLVVFNIPTIRTFGIFTGIGILSSVVLEMTFIPAVRSLLKPPSDLDRVTEAQMRIWDRIPRWIGDQIIPPRRRRLVMLGLAFFAVLCLVGLQRVQVNGDSRSFFAESLRIRLDDEFLTRQLGGTSGLYIMVEGDAPDTITSPAVLKAIEHTQRFAESQPFVGKTLSIVDYLKRMNQAMNGDQPSANRLPSSRALVSQYLLLYSMAGEPGDFDSFVDYEYKAAKITVLLRTSSSADTKPLLEALKAYTAEQFRANIKISFGGDVSQTIALVDTMIHGKILNIVQIALVIFVISAFTFRSPLAGMIVLLPLAMAILAVFGVMGACNIPLNVPNSLISAMAVGIGADYAIYLLYRMREQVQLGFNVEAAVRRTLATAGKATLYVATAVSAGYGVLSLSIGYNVHLWLSLFIVLAMVVSALTALTLVPSVVLYLKPRFIFDGVRHGPMWRLIGRKRLSE